MSVRAISMALHVHGVSTRAKLVLIGLCDCANDDTFTCYPSRKHLAGIGDCSVDTVDRALKELDRAGYIDMQPQFVEGSESRIPSVNLYRVFPAFDPSRKNAATPPTPSRNIAARAAAEMRPPSPHSYAATVAARDAATKEPSLEPESYRLVSAPVSKDAIEFLIIRAGDACDPTAPSLHHGADLNRLLRGGCSWDDDILPAVDQLAASFRRRRARFGTWSLLSEHALRNRDLRLAGVAAPEPVGEPRRQGGRVSIAAVVDRMEAEGKLK